MEHPRKQPSLIHSTMYISKKKPLKLLLLLVAISCQPHQATSTNGDGNQINHLKKLRALKAAHEGDNYDDEQNNSQGDDTIKFNDYADTQKGDVRYLSYFSVKNTQGQPNNNAHNKPNCKEDNNSNNNVLDPDFKKGATKQTYQNAFQNIADANDKDENQNNNGAQNSSGFANQDPPTPQTSSSDSTNTTHPNNNKDAVVTNPQGKQQQNQRTILSQIQNIGAADLFFMFSFLGLIVSALVIVIQKLKK